MLAVLVAGLSIAPVHAGSEVRGVPQARSRVEPAALMTKLNAFYGSDEPDIADVQELGSLVRQFSPTDADIAPLLSFVREQVDGIKARLDGGPLSRADEAKLGAARFLAVNGFLPEHDLEIRRLSKGLEGKMLEIADALTGAAPSGDSLEGSIAKHQEKIDGLVEDVHGLQTRFKDRVLKLNVALGTMKPYLEKPLSPTHRLSWSEALHHVENVERAAARVNGVDGELRSYVEHLMTPLTASRNETTLQGAIDTQGQGEYRGIVFNHPFSYNGSSRINIGLGGGFARDFDHALRVADISLEMGKARLPSLERQLETALRDAAAAMAGLYKSQHELRAKNPDSVVGPFWVQREIDAFFFTQYVREPAKDVYDAMIAFVDSIDPQLLPPQVRKDP